MEEDEAGEEEGLRVKKKRTIQNRAEELEKLIQELKTGEYVLPAEVKKFNYSFKKMIAYEEEKINNILNKRRETSIINTETSQGANQGQVLVKKYNEA